MDDPSGPTPRAHEWDAEAYHRVSVPHGGWARDVVDRLELTGDETVLDLGIGTGRVATWLLQRLPRGRVIGIDSSERMLEKARQALGDDERVTLIRGDLLELAIDPPADAAASSATFHWVLDQDRLFARIRRALRDGGQLAAQYGGRGNIAALLAIVDEVTAREPFAEHFAGWERPWRFAGVDETVERLERAGFQVEDVWTTEAAVVPEDPHAFMRTVTLGPHLERLPEPLREPFLDAVVQGTGGTAVHDYVRINVLARAREGATAG
jgi:trans-aconitate 2-methyltransferase